MLSKEEKRAITKMEDGEDPIEIVHEMRGETGWDQTAEEVAMFFGFTADYEFTHALSCEGKDILKRLSPKFKPGPGTTETTDPKEAHRYFLVPHFPCWKCTTERRCPEHVGCKHCDAQEETIPCPLCGVRINQEQGSFVRLFASPGPVQVVVCSECGK